MESFHDFKMTKDLPMVQQAQELQLIKFALPNKFVAGCIIAKLPPSCRNFATALKHKRQEISVENLIASLDVEEKARAKETTEKGEGQLAPTLCRKADPQVRTKGTSSPPSSPPSTSM
jgi:hypothetical protein